MKRVNRQTEVSMRFETDALSTPELRLFRQGHVHQAEDIGVMISKALTQCDNSVRFCLLPA